MKPAREHAVLYKVGLLRARALVVEGNVARAFLLAAVVDGEYICAHLFAERPLLFHILVAQHKVRFRLVSERFVREHARRRG